MAHEPTTPQNLSGFLNHIVAKLQSSLETCKFHDEHSPYWEDDEGHAVICSVYTRRTYNISYHDGTWDAYEWGVGFLDARLTGILRGQVRDDSGNMVDRPAKAVAP